METIKNRFGEKETNWSSHKHPENPNYMQVVRYMHIQSPDGRNTLYWCLANASVNDRHYILNITLAEAQEKFVDVEEKELTEEDFQNWLAEQK
jgi:hypothetical protein